MKKVSELTGAELDYWVAKALGKNPCIESGNCMVSWNAGEFGGDETRRAYFQPSVDWNLGGQIIERERICILPFGQATWGAVHFGDTFVRYHDCTEKEVDSIGPTPLIAAMRAYVASKYGQEVVE